MTIGLLGKKLGMTQVFDLEGDLVAVTILELGPNAIVQIKSSDGADGYDAIKVGYGATSFEKLNRPEGGVFLRANVDPYRNLAEFRVDPDEVSDLKVGDSLNVTHFTPGDKIDVTGTSKGRGYQGVIKRHGFKGAKEMTHGTHEYKRHSGSIGCSAYPARVIKGKKMAGQMGNTRITVPGLTVVAIHANENVLLVKGAVPGAKNSLVTVAPSV
jgi:large subunit ribosomal protein L3